jgi:serine/threonine protein kinase
LITSLFSIQIATLKNLELDFDCVEQVSCFVVGEHDSYDSGGCQQYCVAIEKPTLTLDRVVAGMLKNEACRGNSELRKRYIAKIFSVLRSVAKALHRLHSFGIVHGDVSAQRCGKFDDAWKLLGTLKLQKVGAKFDAANFGMTVPPEALEPRSTSVALERQAAFRTNVDVDPSIDIWGFGKLAYDVLVGEPLIQFDARKELHQDHRALLKILNWSTLDLVEVRQKLRQVGVSDSGVVLIAKCLSQDADSRPASMNEVLRSDLWQEDLQGPKTISQQNSDLHEC